MRRFDPELKPSILGLLALCLGTLGIGIVLRHGGAGLDGAAVVGFALAIVFEPDP